MAYNQDEPSGSPVSTRSATLHGDEMWAKMGVLPGCGDDCGVGGGLRVNDDGTADDHSEGTNDCGPHLRAVWVRRNADRSHLTHRDRGMLRWVALQRSI